METIGQSDRPKVFICHAWSNKNVAYRIETELKAAGLNVWVDHSEVVGGDVIPEDVSEAIEACGIFVLIWSRAAKRSEWVKREWTAACNLGKKIIAFRIDRTKLPAILMGSAHLQARKIDSGIADLAKAIKGIHPESGESDGGIRLPLEIILGVSGVFVLIVLLILTATPNAVFEIEVFAKKCNVVLDSDAPDEEETSLLFSGIWTNSVSYEGLRPVKLFVQPQSIGLPITNPITIEPDPSNGRITFASTSPEISIQDIVCSANSKVALQLTNGDLLVELQAGRVRPYHSLSLGDTVSISVQNCTVTDDSGKDLTTIFEKPVALELQVFSRSLTLYGQEGDLDAIIRKRETGSYEQPQFLRSTQIQDLSFDKSLISSTSSEKQSTIDSVSVRRDFPRADTSLKSQQPGDLDLIAEPNSFLITNLSIRNDLVVINMQGKFESLKLRERVSSMEMVPGLLSWITPHQKLTIFLTGLMCLFVLVGLHFLKQLREKR